jgi:hypothetical protein
MSGQVFDEQGYEYDWDGNIDWVAKPKRNPVPREQVQYEEGHLCWVLADQ